MALLLFFLVGVTPVLAQDRTREPGVGSQPPGETSNGAAREIFERIAHLETRSEGGESRLEDVRNLIFVLFGGLVAVLCAIGAPLIFRERRERRELRELANLERERLGLELEDAITRIDNRIAEVQEKLDRETELLRESLVQALRSQALIIQQELEDLASTQREEFLESTPPLVARRALQRLEVQLADYSKTLSALDASPAPIDHLLRGNFYLREGRPEDVSRAIEEAQRALELDTENVDAMVLLGRARLQRNEEIEAFTVLEKALARDPEDESVVTYFIQAAMRAGHFDRAAELGERLLKDSEFPNRAWLTTATAGSLARINRSQEAVGLLDNVLREEPELSQVRAHLVELLIREGRAKEAAQTAGEGLEINPTDHQMRRLYARALGEQGAIKDAVKLLDQVAESNPRDIKIYLTKARLLRETGRHPEAIDACRVGLRLHGPVGLRALLHVNLAQCLSRTDQAEEAVVVARKAVELGAAYVLNHLVLLETLLVAEKYSEGIAAAEDAMAFATTDESEALIRMFAAVFAILAGRSQSYCRSMDGLFSKVLSRVEHGLRWDFAFLRSRIAEARVDVARSEHAGEIVDCAESASAV